MKFFSPMFQKIENQINIIFVIGYHYIMPYMIVHHKVGDFKKWKTFFDQDENTRKMKGSKSSQVFQNAEDPTDIFILFEWDSIENARKFSASEDLKKTMEQAGVINIPHIHFLNEVEKSKAWKPNPFFISMDFISGLTIRIMKR